MMELVKAFYEIALIRRGPEFLPSSAFLLAITVAAYSSVGLIANAARGIDLGSSFGTVVLDVALMLGWFWALLAVGQRLPRYRQTVTALTGALTLINILSLPLMIWSTTFQDTDVQPPLYVFSLFAVFFWALFVVGHILSRALGMHLLLGVFLAFVYYLAADWAIRAVFPGPV